MSYLVNNTPVIDGNRQTSLANVSILGANGYLSVTVPLGQGSVIGYTSGGVQAIAPTFTNTIDKFPFASDANASDVGDLTVINVRGVGQTSADSGYTSGGTNGGPVALNVIDKFPFSTNANASDVGDLTVARSTAAGQNSNANGYTSGGINFGGPATSLNVIDKFPFASNANASDVGDLTVARSDVAGQSSTTSGYSSGGYGPPVRNVIDKFPFATNSNASDVGDLTAARSAAAGQQY